MVNFSQTPNPLFETVFKLFTVLKGSRLAAEKLEEHSELLHQVADFFSCDEQQAAVLSIIVRINIISDDNPSVKTILRHLGLKASYANSIHEVLEPFVKRSLLQPEKDISLTPLTSYRVSVRLIKAFNGMNKESLEEKPVTNTLELSGILQRVVKERVSGVINFETYVQHCNDILSKYHEIPLAKYVLEQGFNEFEIAYIVFFCVEYFKGEECFHYREIFEHIKPPREQRFQLRQYFSTKSGSLFDKNVLRLTDHEDFTGRMMFGLSDNIIHFYNPSAPPSAIKKRAFESDFMRVKEFDSIQECMMIYNEREDAQIGNLHRLLEKDRYESFLKQMKTHKMSGGLTALLYGDSGTGKTETVQQLARTSGRHLLMVDAGAIRSKWVGETEKNLNKVFNEYKKAAEMFAHKPILLFNEADAILTKRGVVKDRGDHYENAIQNLLLQQLEAFDGIFMGTTNLSDNLDQSFQRRILFKVHFQKPTELVRKALFENAFPEIDSEDIARLAVMYNMTGSEIMNVKKKLTIERVLHEEEPALELIHTLCIEELSMQPGMVRKSIGFHRA